MSASEKKPGRRRRRMWYFVVLVLLIAVVVGASVYLTNGRKHGPRLLNEQTEAREARPFSTEPDKRFAPLKIEREKHDK
jgi:hypothetical protein